MRRVAPARLHRAALALALAAMPVACSIGGAGDVVGEAAGPPSPKPAPLELDRRLLDAEALGAAWIEQTRLTFDSRADAPPPFEPGTWCPAAAERAVKLEALAAGGGAMVELTETAPGGGVHDLTQQVWSDGRVTRFVEAAEQAFAVCAGTRWTGPDGESASMTQVSLAGIADGAAGARLEAVVGGPDGTYVWSTRLAVVRVGSTVMVLRELDARREGRLARQPEDAWLRLVRAAAARLARPGTD